MYREELAASTSNAADDKKVDILLQRDQTISEVCLRLHMYMKVFLEGEHGGEGGQFSLSPPFRNFFILVLIICIISVH